MDGDGEQNRDVCFHFHPLLIIFGIFLRTLFTRDGSFFGELKFFKYLPNFIIIKI